MNYCHYILCLFLSCFLLLPAKVLSQSGSPYKVNKVRDGVIMVGGIGMSAAGSYLLRNQEMLTEADLVNLDVNNINRFDRFAAGYHSDRANISSDYFFYSSFAMPFFLLLDQDVKQNAPSVFLLYGQAMALTGGIYSLTAGLTKRKRPNVYAKDAPLDTRLHKYATNSFFAGHPAASASATFFAAKVFHDFNPDSPARPYVWAAAAAIPATVGYLRLRAGKHFLSDILVGYAVGAGVGILVPQLHKRSANGWSIHPVKTATYEGAAINYTF